MDRFDSMNLLVRVVERRSFSAAASDLGIPRSSATLAIKQFEQWLGVLLTAAIKPLISGGLKTVDGFDGLGYVARGFAACPGR